MGETKRKAMAMAGTTGDAKRMRTSAGPLPTVPAPFDDVGDGAVDKEPPPPFPPSPPATEPDNTTSSAADNSVVPSAPASHFKLLPGEIRNMIYRYCLVSDRTIVPESPRSRSHHIACVNPETERAAPSSALGTDKDKFGEVLSLFYGENKFGLSSPYHKCWVNRVGKRGAGCIRAIVIRCEGNANHAKSYLTEMQTALVKRCPNLQSIGHNCD
ncbi:LOW QUALITY PROTEIN: hypothetical protein QC764_405148 [Podospora pseudoanserina]|uniref:Uncharacterized protein n=1 Tax=Podospora pseudoanserina TaxID=2609844 RepID=A0ABR0IAQ1_9PEZI|nr:LOW QUALITY PROTEIN: hypothetical protein QC764_405148 [Podospora pseudoanserina]